VGFEAYMIFTDRLGIRIGDIFADTQVVDAKVLSREESIARTLRTVSPAPPGPSASATQRERLLPPARAAA
jgi:hypothetical protein